jgi:hypothetical protein
MTMDDKVEKKNRRFLQGAAAIVATLVGAIGTANTAPVQGQNAESIAVTQVQPEFVIAPAQSPGAEALWHTSHQSHASHASHASHSSHSSHYSYSN